MRFISTAALVSVAQAKVEISAADALDIVEGFLEGAVNAEGLEDLGHCIQDVEAIIPVAEKTYADCTQGLLDGKIQCVKDLAEIAKEAKTLVTDCTEHSADKEKLDEIAAIFSNPISFAWHVGKDLFVNGIDIFKDVTAALIAYGNDWRKFGLKLGHATALVIIGDETQAAIASGFYLFDEAAMIGLTDAPKIKIELFYESECPGCKQAITTSFKKAMNTDGFFDMADVTLYPYGNAHEKQGAGDMWDFTCQHGVTECHWNMIEACAQDALGACPWQSFNFLENLEENISYGATDYEELVSKAVTAGKLDDSIATQINTCHDEKKEYGSAKGNALVHAIAVKTEALNPPHKYVPWVVADGAHTEDINDAVTSDLLGYVCKHFTGTKAAACNSLEAVEPVAIEKCFTEPNGQCDKVPYAWCCGYGTPCDCSKGTISPGQCKPEAYAYCCDAGTPCDCNLPGHPFEEFLQ